MTKLSKDNLFVLVKSMTKSEKRQFKLYVGRLGVNEDSKFLLLFKALDSMKKYNEHTIIKQEFVKKKQLYCFSKSKNLELSEKSMGNS